MENGTRSRFWVFDEFNGHGNLISLGFSGGLGRPNLGVNSGGRGLSSKIDNQSIIFGLKSQKRSACLPCSPTAQPCKERQIILTQATPNSMSAVQCQSIHSWSNSNTALRQSFSFNVNPQDSVIQLVIQYEPAVTKTRFYYCSLKPSAWSSLWYIREILIFSIHEILTFSSRTVSLCTLHTYMLPT